jgi:hypothetical protein
MTAISASRTIIPILAFVACGVALAFAIQHVRESPADTLAATTAPMISKPASEAREQSPAQLATAKAEANAVVDALAGSPPPPENSDGVPTFDVARIEPTGEAVAGRRRRATWNCWAAKCMIARSRINPGNSSSFRPSFLQARTT